MRSFPARERLETKGFRDTPAALARSKTSCGATSGASGSISGVSFVARAQNVQTEGSARIITLRGQSRPFCPNIQCVRSPASDQEKRIFVAESVNRCVPRLWKLGVEMTSLNVPLSRDFRCTEVVELGRGEVDHLSGLSRSRRGRLDRASSGGGEEVKT